MHTYSWDKADLIERKKEIEHQLDLYEELYNLYDNLIDNYEIDNTPTEVTPTIKNKYKKKIIDFKQGNWEKLNQEKIQLITNASCISSYFYIPFEPPILPTINLVDEDLVIYTRELISAIPNNMLLQKFDYYTNPDNHFLHIRHNSEIKEEDYGFAAVDASQKKSYGLVSRNNTIEDVISLSHEIFHMILRENEEPLFCYSNKSIYTETEGYFANMLLNMLLKEENVNKNDLNKIEKFELQVILEYIRTIIIVNSYFNNIDEKGNIHVLNLRKNLKLLNIRGHISKRHFSNLLSNDIMTNFHKSVSYLIGLDLFELYEQDPEKALYNLFKLPTLDGNNPQKELSEIGVTFFEDGYTNLQKKCKKLLKEKTTSYSK